MAEVIWHMLAVNIKPICLVVRDFPW